MFMDNEPGEERLVADWTLTLEDMIEVEKCRGESNRRWFAVQLCYLRNEGRFLEDFANFPLKIINFISLQLGLIPVLLMTEPEREATISGYRSRILNYLGAADLSDEIENGLRKLLKQEAVAGKNERDLLKTAEVFLRESLLFAQEDVYTEIADLLSEEVGAELESLLETENKRSQLFDLKEYPPKATSAAILKYLDKYNFVNGLTKDKIDLNGINPLLIKNLAGVCKRYNVWQLKRFPVIKRRALLACFISETEKFLLDYLVEMHEQFLLEMIRHTKHSFEEKSKKAKRQVRQGVSILTEAVGYLLQEAKTKAESKKEEKLNLTAADAQIILAEFFDKFGVEGLTQAVDNCQEWQEIEEKGYLQEIRNYFSDLGKYFYRFSELPFETVSGSEYLLEALEIVRKLNRREIKEIPETAVIKFVPPVWRKGLYLKKSINRTILDRRLWIAALALAVRDALRSGTLYLPDSRRFGFVLGFSISGKPVAKRT